MKNAEDVADEVFYTTRNPKTGDSVFIEKAKGCEAMYTINGSAAVPVPARFGRNYPAIAEWLLNFA